MKILVANLGSTSFKYRVYDLGDPSEPLLARGAVERIGSEIATVRIPAAADGSAPAWEETRPIKDHAEALAICLNHLSHPDHGVIESEADLAAIGFKAVHARGISGVQRIDHTVLEAMEAFNAVAPAHNPPYVRAMRDLAARFPSLPLVAAFETDFHRDIPEFRQVYAIPSDFRALGVRRYGFHGASHRYIAGRIAQLLGRTDLKVISCHLGGSSSVCAIEAGQSRAASMGMSPQSGLPQNNRVGDFDPFALPYLIQETGKTLDEILQILASRSGLAALSEGSGDLRDIEADAARGVLGARLALDHYIDGIRQLLGSYFVILGGADVIVFTGGIGENSQVVRAGVCGGLDWFGIQADEQRNREARGEASFHAANSRVQLWTVPTNEELVVARQTRDLLIQATSC
ncbi:acetate kinase [Isosphaera pallida ATCC 43644]|uniref:Acetate kinase n=1 Tax=Isosphaera pallida (strain ATCC 43644 / DSM 9630 / IS1B) TaxID=575540 RepID=E8R085_ISOPI|nr:acetate/propionate family kinase [Isosphaera pallida]ADV62212.1 acetate kinase [Isosphaera pallida ATCC 43644]